MIQSLGFEQLKTEVVHTACRTVPNNLPQDPHSLTRNIVDLERHLMQPPDEPTRRLCINAAPLRYLQPAAHLPPPCHRTLQRLLHTSALAIMPPIFWTIGCIYGASSVAFGAFGAHGLKRRIADPARINNWVTAAHYQVLSSFSFHNPPTTPATPTTPIIEAPPSSTGQLTLTRAQLIHSGVLLLATAVAPQNVAAASLLTAGMTLFSGSIYLLVLDPQRFRRLGPVTPLGGLCLIAGWGALAFVGRGRFRL